MFAPELALVGTIVALLLVPLIIGRSSQVAAGVTLMGALVTLALTWRVAGQVDSGAYAGMAPPGSSPMLLVDNFSVFFKLLLMLFVATVTWLWMLSPGAQRQQDSRRFVTGPGSPEFFVLLLTSALGMALMVGTLNLLVMILAIETASLPSYAIVASDKRSRPGAEASLKYVLFGAATSSIMIYGLSLVYGSFGTLDLPTIAAAAGQTGFTLAAGFGLFALCVGVAFKISAVPFHFWCPDVFEGAPIEVTTWLSVASKAAGLGLLLRIVYALSAPADGGVWMGPISWGIGLVAALTCTVGNLAALRQDAVKRILAYSSIAHAGYMMMAAAIFTRGAELAHLNIGLAAVVAYIFVYLIMNLGAFSVTAMVAWRTGSDHISSFTGLGRRAPWLALPLAVCLFSLIGLPPLGGFAAKWWLLVALGRAASAQPWLWALIVVAVINTAISLYYYVRIIRQMYLRDDERQPKVDAPLGGLVMVNLCAVALLLLGTVLFSPLGNRAERYASNLFGAPSTGPIIASAATPADEPTAVSPER
jgi:NADH-quinone oxidoreductase subunit N